MLSEIVHSVSTLYGLLDPVMYIDIKSIINKLSEYIDKRHVYQTWEPHFIHQVLSPEGSHTIANSPLGSKPLSKTPFPSQITFVISTTTPDKFFKIKVTVSSQIQIPGVMASTQNDIVPCLEELLLCLKYVLGVPNLCIKNLEPRMLNFKFNFGSKKIDFYKLDECLNLFEADKIRLDTEHIKYFVKRGEFDKETLVLMIARQHMPCRLHIDYNSLSNALVKLDAINFPRKIDILTRQMESSLGWYVDKMMYAYLLDKIIDELEKDYKNYLILHVKNACANTCMTLTFRPKELLGTGKEVTVQLYPTGKINVNNGINYKVATKVYGWLTNFFRIYSDFILY